VCPALGRDICSVCCGQKRLVEIQCPSDCAYLSVAKEHPPAIQVRRQQGDVTVLLQSMRDLNERQSQLFLMTAAFLVRHRPSGIHKLIDEDVAEASDHAQRRAQIVGDRVAEAVEIPDARLQLRGAPGHPALQVRVEPLELTDFESVVDFGKRLDAVITRTVPKVQKAVKWNSPFYGIEGQGWFLSFHVFTKYVKVSFFRGTSLRPLPPGHTEKSGEVRWIDIYESDKLDEAQMAKWVKQAAALPGWVP